MFENVKEESIHCNLLHHYNDKFLASSLGTIKDVIVPSLLAVTKQHIHLTVSLDSLWGFLCCCGKGTKFYIDEAVYLALTLMV